MKTKMIAMLVGMLVVSFSFAAEIPLPMSIPLGSMIAVEADIASYNLNDNSWLINVTPVFTNQITSNTNAVTLKFGTLAINKVSVRVEVEEVLSVLGKTNLNDTLIFDFQNAVLQAGVLKMINALTP